MWSHQSWPTYVTVRYAALVPFGEVAVLLSEVPTSGAQNAGTVRNRTRRVSEKVVRQHVTEMATQTATPSGGAVVVGLDSGYVRSRRRQEERHFEVVAGKVMTPMALSTASPSLATAARLGRSVRAGTRRSRSTRRHAGLGAVRW